MKKQNKPAFAGKPLSKAAMKNLKGSWGGYSEGGLWVCTANGYRCYLDGYNCLVKCSDPSSCTWYPQCP